MYNKKIQIAGLYFVLPTLIIYGIFLIYPMITAFHYSFFKWNLLSEKKYVGLSNFAKMINDKRFWNSYITTFHFTLISIVIISNKSAPWSHPPLIHLYELSALVAPLCFPEKGILLSDLPDLPDP